jgi:hypothetical protein
MPTANRAAGSSCSSTRRLPPVDSARPVSTTKPSSIRPRTTVEMVAPVSPVAAMMPTRLIVPAARMTSRTAARVLACGVVRGGPLIGVSLLTWFVRMPSLCHGRVDLVSSLA